MPDGTSRFSIDGKIIYHFMGCSTFSGELFSFILFYFTVFVFVVSVFIIFVFVLFVCVFIFVYLHCILAVFRNYSAEHMIPYLMFSILFYDI